ncbi:hypothetical protein [Streptomyces sp. NPDC059816]|uniref:hypothetical protein n=1 Tax=Streptomyces sp. NPDC059816 TaxID=3346960 RepID=UPI00364E8427
MVEPAEQHNYEVIFMLNSKTLIVLGEVELWSASWASAQEEPSRRSPQECSYTAARWDHSPIGQVRSLIRIWPATLAITW